MTDKYLENNEFLSVRTIDDWYRTGEPCKICHKRGLCRHRDIEADVAALRALERAICSVDGQNPQRANLEKDNAKKPRD